jgi:hypothetical protein
MEMPMESGAIRGRVPGEADRLSWRMEISDPVPERISPALAAVPGVFAVVLGGSRASGAAHVSSDYDIGLYFSEREGLDVLCLLEVVRGVVDTPAAARVTEVGGWGPWIVGGGWLTIAGKKVDLLYRPIEGVEKVILDCREGRVSIDYQPGHPHGFCSAIWMDEVALCRALSDSQGVIARLKMMSTPYPEGLREALIRRFQWEIFSASKTRARPSREAIRLTFPDAHSGRSPARRKPFRPQPALSHP